MQLRDINQAVQSLINNGELIPITNVWSGIQYIPIYPTFRPLFTDKAAKVLHNKVLELCHQRMEVGPVVLIEFLAHLKIRSAQSALDNESIGWKRVIDLVHFFGSCAGRDELGSAIAKVAETINHLADKGYITGALQPLSIIEIQNLAGTDKEFVVVSYVAITQAGEAYAKQNLPNMMFPEGGIPKNIKDQV